MNFDLGALLLGGGGGTVLYATSAELDACRESGRRKDAELERLRGR
jgi:hypothetical protein